MKKSSIPIFVALFIIAIAFTTPVKAQNFEGTHAITLVVPNGLTIDNISTDSGTAVIILNGNIGDGTTTISTSINEKFDMIFPVYQEIYVVYGDDTEMPNVTVNVPDFDTVEYTMVASFSNAIKTSIITTTIETQVIKAESSVVTKSFFVMYPAFIMNPVNVSMHETGYFFGISIGYYTVDQNGSLVYVPTVPAERNINLVWDPINQKVENIAVTAVKTTVFPQVTTYEVLGKLKTATYNATIIQTNIGLYNDALVITKTGQGLATSGLIISYHYGTPKESFVVYPAIFADMNSFFQVVSYGKEQVNWLNNGPDAAPMVIVPYTGIFLGRTYSGFMTIFYDDKNNEFIQYDATYTYTFTEDLVMVMTGTYSVLLSPGQFAGVLRSQIPLTTTFTTTVYVTTVTNYTSTMTVVD